MNEPKISITVMPGAQMNGYVKEQHNYFGTVQQITMQEAPDSPLADASDAEVDEEGDGDDSSLQNKIAACFTQGLLDVNEPSQLYFLLLAMQARRLLESTEIASFVRLVIEAYPQIIRKGDEEKKITEALYNMNRKSSESFDTYVKDQSSMIQYIETMYPKKVDGGRRKECEAAVSLATKLHMALK
jgi:hypothetical protein